MKEINICDLVSEEDCAKYEIGDVYKDPSFSVYSVVKEDIKKLLAEKRQRWVQRQGIYDFVPVSELEKSIHEVLNRKEVDVASKRRENAFLFDFEKKMQRYNRIKSKRFRRVRRLEKKKRLDGLIPETGNIESTEPESVKTHVNARSESSVEEKNRQLSCCDAFPSSNNRAMQKSTEERIECTMMREDYQNEFSQEKLAIADRDMPSTQEIILPGWGVWGGQGCEIKRTEKNVIKRHTHGTEIHKRMDSSISHVIINEKQPPSDKKYRIVLPYGYTKEEYRRKIGTPLSKEWASLRIFNRFVKPKPEAEVIVEQFHFDPKHED